MIANLMLFIIYLYIKISLRGTKSIVSTFIESIETIENIMLEGKIDSVTCAKVKDIAFLEEEDFFDGKRIE